MKHPTVYFACLLWILSASLAPADENKAVEVCRAKLIQAQKLDVLADLDWKPGKQPKVVVGSTFEQLPMDAKQGFAETVNCFLLGGKRQYIDFDVLEHLNHRVVGKWTHGRYNPK